MAFDMRVFNVVRSRRFARSRRLGTVAAGLLLAGCATVTPEYVVRPTPAPVESDYTRRIEQTISAYQAQELEKNGGRRLRVGDRVYGFDPQATLNRLSRVTERPGLDYRLYLIPGEDPNAAALGDGRTYITEGMLQYLASRGSREDELATILGHELAHTVAQHLVQRYEQLQKQQMMLALVGIGTAAVTKGGGERAQQLGGLARDVASIAAQVVASGYSQDQELEADQLGVRYLIKAGYDPRAALALLEDFKRFDQPGIEFLRSHPYTERRVEDLRRYLQESGYLHGGQRTTSSATGAEPAQPPVGSASSTPAATRLRSPAPSRREPASDRDIRRQRLLDAQKLYPRGSQSWRNLQQQIDRLQ